MPSIDGKRHWGNRGTSLKFCSTLSTSEEVFCFIKSGEGPPSVARFPWLSTSVTNHKAQKKSPRSVRPHFGLCVNLGMKLNWLNLGDSIPSSELHAASFSTELTPSSTGRSRVVIT